MSSPLSSYHHKRDFSITGEPKGKTGKRKNRQLAFVIQKHGARRLHYDFRLELDGVMKSWAVTRGPSYDPADKRLAVQVEDHPLQYNHFEGVIPAKQYGAGPVMIWDNGEWIPEGDPHQDLKKGHLTFQLQGKRMHGRWHLVRMKTTEKRDNWLLIKGDDEYVLKGKSNQRFLEQENTSIVSDRTLNEIRAGANGDAADNVPEEKEKMQASSAKLDDTPLTKKYARPELATLVEFPPSGSEWLHEIKYDGYRIMAFLEDGKVRLRTRGGKDWTHKFPGITDQLATINVSNAVLDGEIGVLNDRGATSFSALQDALSRQDPSQVEGWFFDLLHLRGDDLTKTPLLERKIALKKILSHKTLTLVHYSDHLESSPHLLKKACGIGAEGLVSKRKDSFYRFRRTKEWLKSKCGQAQEFVIGGFMPAKDGSESIASLLLGYYQDEKLRYAGKVGTGFGAERTRQIYQRLAPLRTPLSPFSGSVEKSRRPHVWVKPELLCEVAFWEWTADQRIRHASFKGLREDKAPGTVRQEISEQPSDNEKRSSTAKTELMVQGIVITHPEREVFPGSGISKGDIAQYYAKVLPFMLPFLKNRLISLVRCTDTIEGQCFFQRNPMRGMGRNLRGKTITHRGNKHNYFYIDNAAGLLELVQMGTIEFHVWQNRVQMIDKPEQIIFDLDPGEDVPFDAVKLAAEDIRRRLQRLDLESFARLSGGKGIHVAVPLKPHHGWDDIKRFCRRFAQQMERDAPDAYVTTMPKTRRTGKIFIDYLRNDFSSTAIAPYSLRARKGAPVAAPLSWKQLEEVDSSQAFNIFTIDALLNPSNEQINQRYLEMRQPIKI
mgnify:FL=1